jgi:choline/ethanolamine kinase
VHGGANGIDVRALEDAPADVLSFSAVSDPDTVRSICHQKVPGWGLLPKDSIRIDQLCEGLSNQNFKVHMPGSSGVCTVLFRSFGKGTSSFYDPELEDRIANMLSRYGVAPRQYAEGEGWRIEEWHFSVPLPNRSMRNPSIMVQVAAHLGRLHKLQGLEDFPKDIASMPAACSVRLGTWGEGCQRAASVLCDPANDLIQTLEIDDMLREREWVKDLVLSDDPKIRGSGLDVVFCHWDCQENNILQTKYGLRLIDFEYAGMEHQAFDIAGYFIECSIDYLVDKPPFYKVSLADFPTEWEQRLFCSIYLSEYLETTVQTDDLSVDVLLERVRRFTLMSHLLWSMWSVIRAGQAPTFGGFDYLQYSQSRWFMYKWAKREMLQNSNRTPHTSPRAV